MKLSEVKNALATLEEIKFQLPNGNFIPKHFHVTEVGSITKNFIDCGGTVREERKINFQLWEDQDFNHRLAPKKLMDIILLSEKVLALQDLEVEVEYQSETIGKYNLTFANGIFTLQTTLTDCLAIDKCIVEEKPKKNLRIEPKSNEGSCCAPESSCC